MCDSSVDMFHIFYYGTYNIERMVGSLVHRPPHPLVLHNPIPRIPYRDPHQSQRSRPDLKASSSLVRELIIK